MPPPSPIRVHIVDDEPLLHAVAVATILLPTDPEGAAEVLEAAMEDYEQRRQDACP